MLKANACVCLRYEILCFIVEGPVSLLFLVAEIQLSSFRVRFRFTVVKSALYVACLFLLRTLGFS